MRIVDLNLILYAINEDAPRHAPARAWWESALTGGEPVGLTWTVILGFLRLTTRPRLFPRPLSAAQALAVVDGWFDQPSTVIVHPGEDHWPILNRLLAGSGTAGNLTTDAHLAAIAIEYGATLCSTDNDFTRFAPELAFLNPLA